MASLNKVHLIGNLTRDPELRVTPKGTAICQFGLALNRQFKGEDGQMRDETTFVDCEAWAKAGETIAKYCTKGKLLYCEGRLKLDTWDDKTTGQKRSKIKIVVEQFQFLGGKGYSEGSQPDAPADHDQTTPPPARKGPTERQLANQDDIIDEDVPF